MRLLGFLILLVCTSCGKKTSAIQFGTTTRQDIIMLKGAKPDREEDIPVGANGKVMVYQDEFYQLDNQVVTNIIRPPSKDESLVLFWKHQFKNCETSEQVLKKEAHSHLPPEIQLKCQKMGLGIVYTFGSDTVTKVLEYANKN